MTSFPEPVFLHTGVLVGDLRPPAPRGLTVMVPVQDEYVSVRATVSLHVCLHMFASVQGEGMWGIGVELLEGGSEPVS